MVRARHGVATRRRKKRVLKSAKGQFGHRSKRYQQAKRSVTKGMAYATRDRRNKKREIKRLWITRISASCRESGMMYSRFIKGLTTAKVEINRKMLADMAVHSPAVFKKLIKLVKDNGSAQAPKKPSKPKTTKTAKK